MHTGTDNAKFFLLAAALDQAEVVIDCVSGGRIPVDATWSGKPTALCYAALNGNAELLSYLLLAGADVGFRDALEMTPLHYAALGGCEACWRSLCAMGASPTARNRYGRSPTALRLRIREAAGLDAPGTTLYSPAPPSARAQR